MNKRHSVIITGSMIAPQAEALLIKNNVEPVVVPGRPSSEQIAAAIAEHDAIGLIVRTGVIDRQVMTASQHLRVVVKHGVGTDNFDIEAANQNGIAVMIAHGANAISVAEHTLALMLSVAKRITQLDMRLRSGHWDKSVHQGMELTGKSVALIGYGQIARRLVNLLQPFDLKISAFVRRPPDDAQSGTINFTEDLDQAIGGADIISVHCPLTAATRNLISTAQFDLMKPSAVLINTARGGIVDESALVAALKANKISAAGLDCFANEPLPAGSELYQLPNVVLTPHVAWATSEATARMGYICVCNVLSVINGRPPDMDCLINPSVLEHKRQLPADLEAD